MYNLTRMNNVTINNIFYTKMKELSLYNKKIIVFPSNLLKNFTTACRNTSFYKRKTVYIEAKGAKIGFGLGRE